MVFSLGIGGSQPPGGDGAPSGPAGGDLGGTYPNPTVLSVADVTTGRLPFANIATLGAQDLWGNGGTVAGNGGPIGLGVQFTIVGGILQWQQVLDGQQGITVTAVSNDITIALANTTDHTLFGNYGGTTVGGPITFGTGVSLSALGVLTASGSGGSVTSVQVSGGTTGLTASGGPVTSSGTIILAGTLAQANGGTGLNSLSGLLALQNAGTVAITGGTVTGMPTPSAASDVANKSYVDAAINGLQVKATAALATTGPLPANVYNNGASGVGATLTGVSFGALVIDGQTVVAGQVVLSKNEVATANNGLYVVTTVGAVATLYVLTRHSDMNTASEFSGAFVPVGSLGTTNANGLWLANPTTPVTVGTTGIPFTQLNGATDLLPGANIGISGNTISVNGTLPVAVGGLGLVSGTSGGILGFTASGSLASSGALTAHGVVLGGGVGAVPTITAAMTNGQLLIGATGADPAPQIMSGDATINSGGTIAVAKVAGNTLSANFGALMNAGTVQVEQSVTLAGTAGGTLTISPGSGTKISVINLAAAGGSQTIAYAGTYNFQSSRIHFKQGATVSTVVLNTGTVGGFIFGTSGGPTSFTVTPTVGAIDEMAIEAPTTAYARVMAIAQGFTA